MCISPFPAKKSDGSIFYANCGQCTWCRLNRRKIWTARLYMESMMYSADNMNFLTLTYDPENLPDDSKLNKGDVQKFLKKLRYYFPENKIRYYAVGEYGGRFGRPHYHLILFGVPHDEDFNDKVQRDIWLKGITQSCPVTPNDISYVARYVQKKLLGKEVSDEFALMSKGLGLSYALSHKEYLVTHGLTIKGSCHNIGQYLYNKLQDVAERDPDFRKLLDFFTEKNSDVIKNRFKFFKEVENLDSLLDNNYYKVACDDYKRVASARRDEILLNLRRKL